MAHSPGEFIGSFFVRQCLQTAPAPPAKLRRQASLEPHLTSLTPEPSTVPFIRTAVPQDTPAAQRQAIVQAIHDALVASIGMPQDELFNLLTTYKADEFFFDRGFNGVARSDRVVVVEITMRRGRSDAMKRALYAQIAHNLAQQADVAPADVFIFTHENDYSDWSVGHGRFAMALQQQRGTDA
jgi:phenylpyruvate tautomerase PptA (4-oxalocrotonate tautomerase family)